MQRQSAAPNTAAALGRLVVAAVFFRSMPCSGLLPLGMELSALVCYRCGKNGVSQMLTATADGDCVMLC